ncbi:hypothetical protein ABZT17_40120 [Streptomyces sp. NPDC005648]|uniref:hypothetical protein n=1 Tax=Streptomyces sp. NPDC005648 TaxID=3157044 RepID=UPI0033A0AD65
MAHRNRSLSRAAALGVAAAAMTLLAGCTQSDDGDSSAHGSSPSAAQSPSSSAAASPSPGTSAGRTTAGSPAKSTGSPAESTGCRSLLASPAVKASVTTDYGRQAQPRLSHITPVKGTFYYGSCDGVRYAGTRFQLTPGSTEAEQVALQDDGAAMKYFVERPGTGWQYVASAGLPADPRGCAAITQIPSRLATLWNDCRSMA